MSWLLIVALKNAIIVVPLAVAALAAGRCFRRPALAHVLWVLVLVKLLTPPLVDVPVGWSIDVSPWMAQQSPAEVTSPARSVAQCWSHASCDRDSSSCRWHAARSPVNVRTRTGNRHVRGSGASEGSCAPREW